MIKKNLLKKSISLLLLLSLVLLFTSACKEKEEVPAESTAAEIESTEDTVMEETNKKEDNSTITIRVYFRGDSSGHVSQTLKTIMADSLKRTNFRISLEPAFLCSYEDENEIIDALLNDDIDAAVVSLATLALYDAKLGTSAMPYMFENVDEARDFINGAKESELEDGLKDLGLKAIGHFDNGFKCFSTGLKAGPINFDLSFTTLSLASSGSQISLETISKLGSQAHICEMDKLKERLSYGRYDGCEASIISLYENKLYNVQKNIAVTNHSFDGLIFIMRDDVWQEFSDNEKRTILSVVSNAAETDHETVDKKTAAYLEFFENSEMTVTYPELGGIKRRTDKVPEAFRNVYGKVLTDYIVQRINGTKVK